MRDEISNTTTLKPAQFERYFRVDLNSLIWFNRQIGASLAEAEDAAQEAMRTLWENWETVENPAAYTRQAARRALYRAHGKTKRAHEAETALHAEMNGARGNDLFDSDVRDVIRMLQSLPKAQREVFALHMDGWETAEIAEITEQASATVRSNLRHARQKLAHMIEDQAIEVTGKEANDGP